MGQLEPINENQGFIVASDAYTKAFASTSDLMASLQKPETEFLGLAMEIARDLARQLIEPKSLLVDQTRFSSLKVASVLHSVNVSIVSMRVLQLLHDAKAPSLSEAEEIELLAICGTLGLLHDLSVATQKGMLDQKSGANIPIEVLKDLHRFSPTNLLGKSTQISGGLSPIYDCLTQAGIINDMSWSNADHDHFLRLCSHIITLTHLFEWETHFHAGSVHKPAHAALRDTISRRDPRVHESIYKALAKAYSIFPIGSHVVLNDGRIGRVINATPETPTRPSVLVVAKDKGHFNKHASLVHLNQQGLWIFVEKPLDTGELLSWSHDFNSYILQNYALERSGAFVKPLPSQKINKPI